MKLLRYGPRGLERPALLDDAGRMRDLGGEIDDINPSTIGPEGLRRLAALRPEALPEVTGPVRIGPCVGRVGKIIGIGLNYSDHAAEAGMALPTEPILFMKATSAICGPADDLELPRGSKKLDWEVELGVVIGTRAKNVTRDQALSHVAGYCTLNDASERAFQIERFGQWSKGKSHDTFAPIGPWLVSADEVGDPQALSLGASVNGEVMQDGTTATMVFKVDELIAYLSQFMTLEPGDIIATGTPPGVGMGMKPPRYLAADDVLTLEVAGLGRQEHRVVAI